MWLRNLISIAVLWRQLELLSSPIQQTPIEKREQIFSPCKAVDFNNFNNTCARGYSLAALLAGNLSSLQGSLRYP